MEYKTIATENSKVKDLTISKDSSDITDSFNLGKESEASNPAIQDLNSSCPSTIKCLKKKKKKRTSNIDLDAKVLLERIDVITSLVKLSNLESVLMDLSTLKRKVELLKSDNKNSTLELELVNSKTFNRSSDDKVSDPMKEIYNSFYDVDVKEISDDIHNVEKCSDVNDNNNIISNNIDGSNILNESYSNSNAKVIDTNLLNEENPQSINDKNSESRSNDLNALTVYFIDENCKVYENKSSQCDVNYKDIQQFSENENLTECNENIRILKNNIIFSDSKIDSRIQSNNQQHFEIMQEELNTVFCNKGDVVINVANINVNEIDVNTENKYLNNEKVESLNEYIDNSYYNNRDTDFNKIEFNKENVETNYVFQEPNKIQPNCFNENEDSSLGSSSVSDVNVFESINQYERNGEQTYIQLSHLEVSEATKVLEEFVQLEKPTQNKKTTAQMYSRTRYPEIEAYLVPLENQKDGQLLGRGFRCTLCGKEGKRCHLASHFKSKHRKYLPSSLNSTLETPKKIKDSQISALEEKYIESIPGTSLYRCSVCGRITKKRCHLVLHIRSKHTNLVRFDGGTEGASLNSAPERNAAASKVSAHLDEIIESVVKNTASDSSLANIGLRDEFRRQRKRRKRKSKARYPQIDNFLLAVGEETEGEHLGRTFQCLICGVTAKKCHLTIHIKSKHPSVIYDSSPPNHYQLLSPGSDETNSIVSLMTDGSCQMGQESISQQEGEKDSSAYIQQLTTALNELESNNYDFEILAGVYEQ